MNTTFINSHIYPSYKNESLKLNNRVTVDDKGHRYDDMEYTSEVIQNILHNYSYFKTNASKIMNTNIISIYLDVDNALRQIKLTERQSLALRYYSRGFTIDQIGVFMGISHQAVSKLLGKACRQLSELLSHNNKKEELQ